MHRLRRSCDEDSNRGRAVRNLSGAHDGIERHYPLKRIRPRQRAEAKSEKIAQRREKVLLKKKADLEQLILFLSQNLALFPDFTKRQHRVAMLNEYQKPRKDRKFEPTVEKVEDNMETILEMLGTS